MTIDFDFPEYSDIDSDISQVTVTVECESLADKLEVKGDSDEQPTGFLLTNLAPADAGTHQVIVTLEDPEGATRMYAVSVTVLLPATDPEEATDDAATADIEIEEGAEEAVTFDWTALQAPEIDISEIESPEFPEVYLKSVSKTGLVTLQFTKEMQIPPLEAIRQAVAYREDEQVPAVLVEVEPGIYSRPEKLAFTYNITKYEGRILEI